MSRICILSAVNIKHMSLISVYTDYLDKRGIPYDIVYMDKYGEEEHINAEHKYVFENKINRRLPKLLRGLYYFKFIAYGKRVLEQGDYDFIIVWNDVAIFLFGDYLARRWNGKYCLNIRDYCHQRIRPIYNIFKRAIAGSRFTTISSSGYRAFLPDSDYIELHSLNETVLSKCVIRNTRRSAESAIRIGFVGNVRFFDINKSLLNVFGNDDRFELHYYGTSSNVLEQYANECGIRNAQFGGSFPVSETHNYLNSIDVINNLYGSGSNSVDYALSIKLYYSIYCHLPILVNTGTYMEEVTKKIGNGFAIDSIDEEMPNRLYEWYQSLDYDRLTQSCDETLSKIRDSQNTFYNALDDVIHELDASLR